MESDKEISIKVNIAERTYPLKVKGEEEEIIRKAADKLNKRIKVYRESFAVRDKEDLLAMCALEAFTDLEREKTTEELSQESVRSKIREIKHLINSGKSDE